MQNNMQDSEWLFEEGQKTFVVRKGKKVQKMVYGLNRRKVRGQNKSKAYSGMDQMRASMSQIKGAKKRKIKMNMTLRKRAKSMKVRDRLGVQNRNPTAARLMSYNRDHRAKVKR